MQQEERVLTEQSMQKDKCVLALYSIINRIIWVLDADWLKAVVYLSNTARGGVVYGQWYMDNIPLLRAVL